MSSVRDTIADAAAGEVKSEASSTVMNAVKNQATTGNLEVAAGIALVGGVVAGIYYLDVKWHHREAKIILAQVNDIELNVGTYLKRIPVSPSETLDMCDPFERDPKTNLLHAGKEYKTIHELRAMVHGRSSEGFSPQANDAIQRAMLKILEFYEDRLQRFWLWQGSEGDVTSAYLRYMLCRLNEYGKKFQGADYTKNILEAVHGSLNDFSMKHGENSERRTYLDLACRSLKKAVKALGQQKKDRTLAELIADATPECDDLATRLLKNLTKLVTPTKQYAYVDRCFDPALIAEGYIKKKTSHGKPGTHPGEIPLNAAPIGQKIQATSQQYEEAKGLSESKAVAMMVAQSPEAATLTEEEKQQQDFALFTKEDTLFGVRRGLHICNYMTTTSRQLSKDNESGTTVPFDAKTESKSILERLNGMQDLIKLNNDNILVMKLFFKLQHYAKEKGDEFIANPANAHFMFDVLLALSKTVRKDADKCEKFLAAIEEDHQFKTLDPDQAHLLTETQHLVKAIREEVESSIKEIENYRTDTHYEYLETRIQVEEHETLQLFAQVAKDKGLKIFQEIAQKPAAPTPPVKPPRPSAEQLKRKPVTVAKENDAKHTSPGQGSSASILNELKPSAEPQAKPKRLPRREPEKREVTLNDLDASLTDVEAQITKNSREDFRRPYEELHQCLVALRNDYFSMHGDTNPDRKLKGDKTKDLTYEVCLYTYNFLCLPMARRHANAQDFATGLHAIVNRPTNGFIDVPFGKIDISLEEYKQGVLGWVRRQHPTTTHGHFLRLIQSAKQLAHRLQPRPELKAIDLRQNSQ